MGTTAKITDHIERRIIVEKIIAGDMLALLPKLSALMEQYTGKKVFKVDGSHTKQFQTALNEVLTPYQSLQKRLFLRSSHYSGYLTLSYWHTWGQTLFSDGRPAGCDDGEYYDIDFYFFKRDGDTITTEENYIMDITARCKQILAVDYETVRATLVKIKALQTQIETLNSTIPYYARPKS